MKIAITGHRPNKLGNDYDLTSPLVMKIRDKILLILEDKIIDNLTNEDTEPVTLITGMALGIDTLFAKIAIELNLPFIAALPCWGQDIKWPNRTRSLYSDLINNPLCTQHIISERYYFPDCMQIRNEWMVDNCDLLIAVWDGTPGGTANCVMYAEDQNKEIIVIDPKSLN